MSMMGKIRKAITGGDWHVAYQKKGSAACVLAEVPENQWVADPFVFEDGDEHYIFVEQYRKDRDKGCIGYYRFMDGKPVNQGIIIENPYHMSYPDVFQHGGKYYMIPESSANSTVDLYVAESFPDKWRKEKTLITGKKYVDSTVYQQGNDHYLISYSMTSGYEIHVFSLNMERMELEPISRKRYDTNIARPGGRLFMEKGKLFRPAQDCSRKYGESLIIYQVDDLNRNGEFVEHEVKRIDTGMFHIGMAPERLHHLTFDSLYEVVDVYKEKIDLLHVPRIYLRSRRR